MKTFWFVTFLLTAGARLPADERLERLPPEDRKWLEEDVVYIITDQEREVYLILETIDDRARFREAFWRIRDPNAATVQNEFKEEHYRRIAYANQYLGRETNRTGWETDRGRYYIILGEPREITRFDGDAELVESELWFNRGDTRLGVPASFYLLFFKRFDVGEFQLYRPMADGPTALLRRSQGMPGAQSRAALDVIQQISPELARAALSVDTRDSPDYVNSNPALGVAITLARIDESAKRAIRTDYADAHLRYRHRVSAEYSFNFVPSQSYLAVLVGPERTPFVHYSIAFAAGDFSLETDEARTTFYTTLDVTLEIRDADGTLLAASEKSLPMELTPSQVEAIGSAPIAYQDDFPVIPGARAVSVIVRERVSKQYTVAEWSLEVDDFSTGAPKLSDVVLGYRRNVVAGDDAAHGAFQIDATHLEVATNETFAIGETVYLLIQVFDAEPDYRMSFALMSGDEPVQEWDRSFSEYQGGPLVEELSLLGIASGNYEVTARLLDRSGVEIAARSAFLVVSPRTAVVRPGLVYRRGFNPRVPGLLELARAEQLWSADRIDEAIRELETSVAANNPELPMASWRLAGAMIRKRNPERALELLEPMEPRYPAQYEVIAGIGFAFHQKEAFEAAADYLERAAAIRSPNTTHWNLLGDSFRRIGKLDEARRAFQRSLQIDPSQEQVKRQLAELSVSKN